MKIGTSQIRAAQVAKKIRPDVQKVAQEFESLFTAMMMRSMRRTVFDGGLIPKSMGEKIYTDMIDNEYAKIISRNASLGLSDQIVNQIDQTENKGSLCRALDQLKSQPWMVDSKFVSTDNRMTRAATVQNQVAQWDHIIDEASKKFGVDRHLITAIIRQESAGNPRAVSSAGAKGLMQLMDTTAEMMGVRRVFDPRENIMGGVGYLKMLLKQFGGNEQLALASYNAGPNAVRKYGGIPPYRETQQYVHKVLSFKELYTTMEPDAKNHESP